jgi:hypothetical protein
MFYRGTCTISEYNASNTYAFLVQLDGRGFRLVSGMSSGTCHGYLRAMLVLQWPQLVQLILLLPIPIVRARGLRSGLLAQKRLFFAGNYTAEFSRLLREVQLLLLLNSNGKNF